jgi:TonB family protein
MLFSLRTLALAAVLLAPTALEAQRPQPRCAVVPDTILPPSEQQVREADELREALRGILTSHGQPLEGLLMVDVNADRRGRLLFMDADIPDTTRAAITHHVADYLRALPGGAAYQALIRMDAAYPAVVAGKRECAPELTSYSELSEAVSRVQLDHPAARRHRDAPLRQRLVLLLVVSREGHVAYADLVEPSGDDFLDGRAMEIAKILRFDPASLDEVPLDARLRLPLVFTVR